MATYPSTVRRQTAETAFEAAGKPIPSALYDELKAASNAEMDEYLAAFDARNPQVETAAEAVLTKPAEEIKKGDVIMTQWGWVEVLYWKHTFASRVINTRDGVVTNVQINRDVFLKAGEVVQIHPNPADYHRERNQASRRAVGALHAARR